MSLKNPKTNNLYDTDVAILKDYGLKKKLILCNSLRKSGYELDEDRPERGTVNDEKLEESISRTKSRIFELAYCNNWEMWVTLTISPQKYDRTDLKTFKKHLSQFIRNYSKKWNLDLKYLFVPELHKDEKSWHLHGFLMGLPFEHMRLFQEHEKLPKQMLKKIKNGDQLFDWTPYREKFGFVSLERIRSHESVSKYITKYITKELSRSVTDLNANMYYCSQGLKRAEEIKRGTLAATNIPFDFSNDYVSVKWLNNEDTNLYTIVDAYGEII